MKRFPASCAQPSRRDPAVPPSTPILSGGTSLAGQSLSVAQVSSYTIIIAGFAILAGSFNPSLLLRSLHTITDWKIEKQQDTKFQSLSVAQVSSYKTRVRNGSSFSETFQSLSVAQVSSYSAVLAEALKKHNYVSIPLCCSGLFIHNLPWGNAMCEMGFNPSLLLRSLYTSGSTKSVLIPIPMVSIPLCCSGLFIPRHNCFRLGCEPH